MDASSVHPEQVHLPPSSPAPATQAPVPNIPDRLFECPLSLISRQQHDPRIIAEQPSFPGKKVSLVLSKNEGMPSSSPSAHQALFSGQSLRADATTKPTTIPRVLALAAFGREDLANEYVDEFIKRYSPNDEDDMIDRDIRDHDRKQFLEKTKQDHLAVVDAYGEEVFDHNAPDAPKVYKVHDEEGKMLRFIWVDISYVEVPEGLPF